MEAGELGFGRVAGVVAVRVELRASALVDLASALTAWSAATAAPPVSLAGIDAKSKSGGQYVNPDGTPTPQLNHSEAIATPTDADINQLRRGQFRAEVGEGVEP